MFAWNCTITVDSHYRSNSFIPRLSIRFTVDAADRPNALQISQRIARKMARIRDISRIEVEICGFDAVRYKSVK